MVEKILLVDDDRNLLTSYQRQLRGKFRLDTAEGGKQGLAAVSSDGPYAVIVSDMRMPGMDGIQFLNRAREIAPDSVRMMLTGNAELDIAMEAVNEGNIFRFLTKPCHPDALTKSLTAGIEQYRLITVERELLEKTLRGSIKVLTELLALANPEAFGRSSRIKRYVRETALCMGVPDVWQLETAAMLSQIGCVTLPQEALRKLYQGKELTGEEAQLFDMHPIVASDLLVNIPRLQEICEIIAYQEKHFDGSGVPRDSRRGQDIPLGARVLKIVLDLDMLETRGSSKAEALAQLKQRSGWYDPAVVAVLEEAIGVERRYERRRVFVKELAETMIFAEDVRSARGVLLISRGNEVTRTLSERLKNLSRTAEIREPIQVLVPVEGQTEAPGVKQRSEGGELDAEQGALR